MTSTIGTARVTGASTGIGAIDATRFSGETGRRLEVLPADLVRQTGVETIALSLSDDAASCGLAHIGNSRRGSRFTPRSPDRPPLDRDR